MCPIKIHPRVRRISRTSSPGLHSCPAMMEWRRIVFMQLPEKMAPSSPSSSCTEWRWYIPSIAVQSMGAFTVSIQRWSQSRHHSLRWKTNGALWGQTDSSSSSSSSCNPSALGGLFLAGTLSCATSVTAGETDEAGPARVLGLLGARAAEALERPEHLQTESNEAARPAALINSARH